ncbi:hypothetical protein ABCS02_22270 [Microbacterium sp. X-17]
MTARPRTGRGRRRTPLRRGVPWTVYAGIALLAFLVIAVAVYALATR